MTTKELKRIEKLEKEVKELYELVARFIPFDTKELKPSFKRHVDKLIKEKSVAHYTGAGSLLKILKTTK